MGLPGRRSLARLLLLSAALSGLFPPPAAADPGRAEGGSGRPATQATSPAGPGAGAGERGGAFVPGRVLVRFEAAVGEERRRTAAEAIGGRVAGGRGRTRVVALDPGGDVRAAARRLTARPEVAFAEPDWHRRVDGCDPDVCWHLQPRPGVDAVAAHGRGATGAGRTVAVVDTGVAAGVADLDGRVAERWRCTTACTRLDPGQDDTDLDPLTSAHGTEVASVVAAGDDGQGITGVAPEATIVSYRVDRGHVIPVSHLRAALLAIADHPEVDVVNLSLSGSQWSRFEQEAIDAVLAEGKTVVASAGNYGNRVPQYPAAFPGVVSVGATDEAGQVASFSSYGKVDLVAPGECVAVAEVVELHEPSGCSDADEGDNVAFSSGTSFAAPIVAGLLALAAGGSPLRARLAAEATAHATPPAGSSAKAWAHGLVDAEAFVAVHDPDAPPSLVLESSGEDPAGGHRFGTGDGQLPHPATTFVAHAFRAGGALSAEDLGDATFDGGDDQAGDGTAAFEPVEAEPGVFRATLASGDLDPGLHRETATATLDGTVATASVPVLVLEPDDQAPGVPLVGGGNDAWRRLDSVDDDDLDDVYAVTLARGDRLDVAVAGLSEHPVAVLLFRPGTVDVLGQGGVVACGGTAQGCPGVLGYQAPASGIYLLDVFSTGLTGAYRLTWTVRNPNGLPVEIPVPACSPNGDGVKDRCVWTAGTLTGWDASAFVTSGGSPVRQYAGGARSWDGRDQAGAERPPGRYTLRVLYTRPGGGRALLGSFGLTLDERPPRIADATAWPNPFEPRPRDGDRDTTTFAMTSSEPGRLRVVIRRGDGAVVRVLVSRAQPAGRQRVGWTGRTAAKAWLRGRFWYVIEAVDAAGNTARSGRHRVRVL